MKDTYIKAVVGLIESGMPVAKIMEGLQSTLKKKGHERLYPRVLLGVQKILASKHERGKTEIRIVKHSSLKELEKEIQNDIKEFAFSDEHEIVEDENLIGGYVLKDREHSLDKSYKSHLLLLYRSFI